MQIIVDGLSRIVFVYKDNAIKFPWINFSRVLKNFLKYKKEGRLEERIKHFHKNKILATFIFIFHTFSSNRREYLYFKKHTEDKFLLPVKGLLFGWILIQPKALILNKDDKKWKKIQRKLITYGVKDVDLLKPDNFCVWNNKVKILDYGSKQTQQYLDTNISGLLIK